MTYEEIRLALVGRMQTFTGIEQARIEYPNPDEIFTPPATGLWCRLSIQGGFGFFAGMGAEPHARRAGNMVVQCFARQRAGTGALTRLADQISQHFQFWSEGHLECWEASLIDAGYDKDFVQFNVVVRYVAG